MARNSARLSRPSQSRSCTPMAACACWKEPKWAASSAAEMSPERSASRAWKAACTFSSWMHRQRSTVAARNSSRSTSRLLLASTSANSSRASRCPASGVAAAPPPPPPPGVPPPAGEEDAGEAEPFTPTRSRKPRSSPRLRRPSPERSRPSKHRRRCATSAAVSLCAMRLTASFCSLVRRACCWNRAARKLVAAYRPATAAAAALGEPAGEPGGEAAAVGRSASKKAWASAASADGRREESFCSIQSTSSRAWGGTPAQSSSRKGTGLCRIAWKMSASVSPMKGGYPHSRM
mmetsp:Transcript_19143/g.31858  ORF Transcript_19143/g.31858 Transcript_19143/m.31858 type:complete len:291 (-) Transcript_19143:313-1185(-)